MRTRKIQSRIEPELEKHLNENIPDFKKIGMSNYVRDALIRVSKFNRAKREMV